MSNDINDVLGLGNPKQPESQQSSQPNFNEQFLNQLQKNNQHSSRIGNLLVGILITTGIVALAVIIVAVKLNDLFGEGKGGGY